MMLLLLRWAVAAASLLITVRVVGGVELRGIFAAFVVTALLAALNALLRPLLIVARIVTWPLKLLTLGLLGAVVSFLFNVVVFYIVGKIGWGFQVDGFWAAAMGALVMGVLSTLLSLILGIRK